jgi:hypothetical protein
MTSTEKLAIAMSNSSFRCVLFYPLLRDGSRVSDAFFYFGVSASFPRFLLTGKTGVVCPVSAILIHIMLMLILCTYKGAETLHNTSFRSLTNDKKRGHPDSIFDYLMICFIQIWMQ